MYDAPCMNNRAGGGKKMGESISQLAQHWKFSMKKREELEKSKIESSLSAQHIRFAKVGLWYQLCMAM